jgi:hypothetical protein
LSSIYLSIEACKAGKKEADPNLSLEKDTSGKSKEHSREVIDNLGGDDTHYGGEDNPRSKTAAENIDGSRAMLH